MVHGGQAGAFLNGDVQILYRKKLECGTNKDKVTSDCLHPIHQARWTER